eukprot:SAG25_NODE_9203_length_382_cov_1.848057_1_plen_29_part_01
MARAGGSTVHTLLGLRFGNSDSEVPLPTA